MYQAAIFASIFAPFHATSASLTEDERAEIHILQRRIDAMKTNVQTTHPLQTKADFRRYLIDPIVALEGRAGARIGRGTDKCLGDAVWELGGIGSIGDTLDPAAERADCIDLAEQLLDEAQRLLATALAFDRVPS